MPVATGGGRARGAHAIQRRPLSVLAIAIATGFLFVTASVNADGTDLRPTGGDISSLLNQRSRQVDDQRAAARALVKDVERLSAQVPSGLVEKLTATAEELAGPAGLTKVSGPGLEVVLSDAPRSSDSADIDPNLLVVHEQDLQAYVNALRAGGASAISLQGQRIISTTGIKCVGNTVLLDGVPYAPPYRIVAVGNVSGMVDSLNSTPATVTYADYSREHGLGLAISTLAKAKIPAYAGAVSLQHAKVDSTS